MEIAFISTINKKLYDEYGKRFLEEFASCASKDIKLFLIFEGEYPEEILNISNNIFVVPLLSSKQKNFYRKFSNLNEAWGFRVRLTADKKLKIKPDYRFNAIRFSFKPFAIHQCLDYLPNTITHLIWTDADLRCKRKFSIDDLMEFLPEDNQLMSYLGRDNFYSECGFLGFNLQRTETIDYINRVVDIYESGSLFAYNEWHDSYIWDQVRKDFEKDHNCLFKNLSGKASNQKHVYMHTNLSKIFDHLKGPNAKSVGESDETEYKV